MSHRPAVRSGISASKAVFLIWIWRPSSWATARALSTSKPIALFGSVSPVSKYSIGLYSMSTQSTSVPGVIRLVGGAIGCAVAGAAVAGPDVAGGVVAAAVVGAVVALPPLLHAATSSAMAAAAAGRTFVMNGLLLAARD